MPINKVDIHKFLSLAKQQPIFDVRSPMEFNYAHIPGAYSLPIFSDDERKDIGTTYKQVNRQEAIEIGLRYFGPKMLTYIKQVETVLHSPIHTGASQILIHCWRGGMRSSAMAWLLSFYGFDVVLLEGGYKSYRNFVLKQFEWPFLFNVLGGYTGSGKTEVLQQLAKQQFSVIDLELLASHKGSAFGALGMKEQPSQEQFENELCANLLKHYEVINNQFVQSKPIWIENESQRIGLVNLTNTFYASLQNATVYFLNIPFEERLQFIINNYGKFDKDKLIEGVYRIQKRLGGLDTKNAVNFIEENNIGEAFRILLSYYDKLYQKSSKENKRKQIQIEAIKVDTKSNAEMVINTFKNNKND